MPTSSNGAQGLGYLDAGNVLQITQSVVRKDRRFPAVALPGDRPTVHMIWRNASPSAAALDALGALAGRVSHVGHSASLTRVSVLTRTDARPSHVAGDGDGGIMLRCPHPGRFDALVAVFDAASRLIPSWPGAAPARRYVRPPGAVAEGAMGPGEEWVVLEASGAGLVPKLEAFPAVAKAMRDAVVSHAADPVHEIISGRAPGGGPLKGPHLAIVPMANVGWGGRSDGGLLGMAHGAPKGLGVRHARAQAGEARRVTVPRPGTRRRGCCKRTGSAQCRYVGTWTGRKSPCCPGRYTGVARAWASATPVVLDRHPNKRQGAADIVAEGCARAGLPRPSSVRVSRHSSVSGAPPAFVGRGARAGWRPPAPGMLDNRFVCHAVLTFEVDVRGPVLVGAGRYYGMGLFLPAAVARP